MFVCFLVLTITVSFHLLVEIFEKIMFILIFHLQGSSAFVYAAMSLADKMSTGAVIALVQGLKPTPTQVG